MQRLKSEKIMPSLLLKHLKKFFQESEYQTVSIKIRADILFWPDKGSNCLQENTGNQ